MDSIENSNISLFREELNDEINVEKQSNSNHNYYDKIIIVDSKSLARRTFSKKNDGWININKKHDKPKSIEQISHELNQIHTQ